MDLNGKTALITGAASGFGEAMAHRFADRGARVAIVDLNLDKAQGVADAIGADKAIALRADVSKRADIEARLRVTACTGRCHVAFRHLDEPRAST